MKIARAKVALSYTDRGKYMILFTRFFGKAIEVFATGAAAAIGSPGILLQGVGWGLIGSSAIQLIRFFMSEEEDEKETDKTFEEMENKFERIFQVTGLENKFGLKPKFVLYVKNSLGTSYVIKLPTGLTADNIRKIKSVIENELEYKITITNNYNKVFIQTVEYPLLDKYELKNHTEKIPHDRDKANFVLGVIKDADGEQYPIINLTSEACNLLIAGIAGSGKSGCTKNIFTQLAYKDIDTWILDMKRGVETRMLEDIQSVKRYEYRTEKAPRFISALNAEMNRRYDMIGEEKCKDYKDYNKKHPDSHIKPLVIIIEEISDLNRLFPDSSEELRSILMKSRAANISIIATIQRPDSKMLDSGAKSQFQNRISFKQVDEINSNIALGNDLAVEMLKGEPIGRGIVQTEQLVDKMFQAFYIEDDDLLKFLKDKIRVKEEKPIATAPVEDIIGGKPIAIEKAIKVVETGKAKEVDPAPMIVEKKEKAKTLKDIIPSSATEELILRLAELANLIEFKGMPPKKENEKIIDMEEKKKDVQKKSKKKPNVEENLVFG